MCDSIMFNFTYMLKCILINGSVLDTVYVWKISAIDGFKFLIMNVNKE